MKCDIVRFWRAVRFLLFVFFFFLSNFPEQTYPPAKITNYFPKAVRRFAAPGIDDSADTDPGAPRVWKNVVRRGGERGEGGEGSTGESCKIIIYVYVRNGPS